MNVLIVRNSDFSTNASMKRIVDALLELNYNVIILSRVRKTNCDEKIIKKIATVNNVEIENYEVQLSSNTGEGMKNISTLFEYQCIIRNWMSDNHDKFDIIHCFDLDCGIVAKKISKRYDKNLNYHIADFYVDSRSKIPRVLKNIIKRKEFSIINYADNTIVCTEERIRQIEGSNPKQLTVIHNSPIVRDISISDKIKNINEKIVLTYIGGLSRRRFIDTVLEVVSENDSYVLNIGGSGELEQKCIEYSKVYRNINYLGKVDYEKTFKIYADSDIMFAIYDPRINNHKFSAPNKLYEAMFLKKPIIVAKDTSVDKIVERYDIGYTINYSKESLIELLDEIESNQSSFEEKKNNLEGIYEQYSWDVMKKKLMDMYINLGDEKK